MLIKAAGEMRNLDAQATPLSVAPVKRGAFYEAYSDIEAELRDLKRATLLANAQVWRALGDLDHDSGKCIGVPDSETVELAIFAVDQATAAARKMEETYDRLWNEARLAD